MVLMDCGSRFWSGFFGGHGQRSITRQTGWGLNLCCCCCCCSGAPSWERAQGWVQCWCWPNTRWTWGWPGTWSLVKRPKSHTGPAWKECCLFLQRQNREKNTIKLSLWSCILQAAHMKHHKQKSSLPLCKYVCTCAWVAASVRLLCSSGKSTNMFLLKQKYYFTTVFSILEYTK